jgi:hypothetical protein
LGFSVAPYPAAQPCARLLTDAGDLDCWLRLRIRGTDPAVHRFAAKLDTGKVLATEWHDGWLHVRIDAPKDGDCKFHWTAGTELYVELTAGTLDQVAIDNWEVHLKDGPHESREHQKWRGRLYWLLRVCSALGLFYAGYEVVKKVRGAAPHVHAVTAEDCLRSVIGEVRASENEADPETALYREFLTEVVFEQRSAAAVADRLLPDARFSKKAEFRRKAKEAFDARLALFVAELQRLQKRSAGS